MCLDGDYVPIHHSGMSELLFLAKFGMYYIKDRVASESIIVKDSSSFRGAADGYGYRFIGIAKPLNKDTTGVKQRS